MTNKPLSTSLLLVLLFSQLGYSQTGKITQKEISKMITASSDYMLNLKCEESLNLAKKALNQAYQINDKALIAKAYNIIGLNYEEFSDFKKAITYYEKGLHYANQTTNDTIKDWLHNNLGSAYCFHKLDFEKGIDHYKKGLFYSKKLKDTNEIIYTRLNIASAYFEIKDFQKGIYYLKDIENIVMESDELEAKISLNSLLGSYYTHTNNFKTAEAFYQKALELCEKNKIEFLQTNACELYKDFAQYYFKIKDYKNAYLYLDKYTTTKNKIYNDQRISEVEKAGNQIELDEYKRQISQIESEKQLQARSLHQSRIIVVLFIITLLFLLLFLFSLYKNNEIRKKINRDLKTANKQLQKAKEQAEEVSQLKSQFISTISHELRTPLYGVVGITDIIADEHKELSNSSYLKSLKFSARYLLSLVNDILQVYKIDEKKITLDNTAFNVIEDLHQVTDSLMFLAEKNQNKLTLEVDEDIPQLLIGDRVRLSQIFMNLIGNALKFTHNGQVKINVQLLRTEGTFVYLQFEVIDNGIGIAEADQEKVFEKFVQIERKEDDYQGTGLGLPIVKQLIGLFNGEIHIESEENVGTKMTFIIGFESDKDKIKEYTNDLEVDFVHQKSYKILVVEDNKINQLVTKKILDDSNFESIIVDNGYHAIELLEKEPFDIVLMDINMPMINGFETTRLIREKGITIPVIALTAFDKQEISEQVYASDMNGIIIKPFEPKQLYQMIVNLCQPVA
ncbi:tetratricopeptide repeat-containing hybrid sensor histidine kinase/response regulator [Flavobacterium sp. UBA4197]|uniref:tetratricopeptide repeat-containing hybrid sensor histidine kinase/response regulator n=1 Tax=Flavobacterium sp. UBA4197 TaxID=1946546 RepID=UPI00257BEDB5|nr:ATP-binding protein [Flavobacterium sp. UBA4197]